METDRAQGYRLGYSDEEIERLEGQHRLWSQENRRFLEHAGFATGATVVDLGCGPGFTTLELARAVGPEGRVIAIDRDDERSLPLLRERARAAGLANVETRAADLESFDLPAESVDGVYGRWVLMYLPEAEAQMLTGRIAGWLRPGGVCALAEFFNQRHAHLHPASEHMAPVTEALVRALAGARGCNPQVGAMVPGWLTDAGLQVEVHVVGKVVQATTPEWQRAAAFYRDHLPPLAAEGFLSEDLLAAFFADWERHARTPHALFYYPPVLEAIGRRP